MDPLNPNPNPRADPYSPRPWSMTRWLGAFAIVAALALFVVTTTSGASPPVAHGLLPRTATPSPTLAPDLLHMVTTPTSTTTTTSAPPRAVEETALSTPEDVPDPSVRRPIAVAGRITIPGIGLDAELRDQITQESIDLGPSHWPGTAAPGGFGNAVIAGHRNSHSAPFHDLGNLRPGDRITLSNGSGQQFTYAVTESFVVNPDPIG